MRQQAPPAAPWCLACTAQIPSNEVSLVPFCRTQTSTTLLRLRGGALVSVPYTAFPGSRGIALFAPALRWEGAAQARCSGAEQEREERFGAELAAFRGTQMG